MTHEEIWFKTTACPVCPIVEKLAKTEEDLLAAESALADVQDMFTEYKDQYGPLPGLQ